MKMYLRISLLLLSLLFLLTACGKSGADQDDGTDQQPQDDSDAQWDEEPEVLQEFSTDVCQIGYQPLVDAEDDCDDPTTGTRQHGYGTDQCTDDNVPEASVHRH